MLHAVLDSHALLPRLNRVCVRTAAAICLTALVPAAAHAKSDVLFPMPETLSSIAATTFDTQGVAVGQSSFSVEQESLGRFTMKIELEVAGGGFNRSQATFIQEGDLRESGTPENNPSAASQDSTVFSPLPPQPRGLRLIEQRAEATSAEGLKLPILIIDHQAQTAKCLPQTGRDRSPQQVSLPNNDRIVNVPLQLLFEPLVSGQQEKVDFQLILCRKGPVVYDMTAHQVPEKDATLNDVVRIEYGPAIGRRFGWIAQRILPKLSFWFDSKRGDYLGHRMPLHSKGPDIVLVRQGLKPADLGFAPQ